jgi:hypothetical protein
MHSFSLKLFLGGVLVLIFSIGIQAQANLSFQGVLKKSNGAAVEDGSYEITFKLYNVESGGVALWDEMHPDVEVQGGIYSVILGSIDSLDVDFNEIYFLGISVAGGSELTPRFQLTSAPYSLALIGKSNKFPSAGAVLSDSIKNKGKIVIGSTAFSSTHTAKVKGGILSDSGLPGSNGSNDKGYGFNGDEDTGLFSPTTSEVGIYIDETEILKVDANGADLQGDLTAENVNLGPSGKVVFDGGLSDWRMVYDSDFSSGSVDGWLAYDNIGTNGWATNTQTRNLISGPSSNPFVSDFITPSTGLFSSSNSVLKKLIDLTGENQNEVKVEFTYLAIGAWENELAFAGFQSTLSEPLTMAWNRIYGTINLADFNPVFNVGTDQIGHAVMTGQFTGTSFYLVFGSFLDDIASDENYGITGVKVWVR